MADHARQHTQSTTGGTSAVGRDLREAREALGISIAQMADSLRIRAAHIEALEEGRFADLPGRPYTFGFARSIARHLGLDPDTVTARLRDEVMGTAAPVELVFPESTEDKRLSRAGWVLISLVAAVLAYAAWSVVSYRSDDRPAEFSSYTPPAQPGPEAVVVPPEQEPSEEATSAGGTAERTDADRAPEAAAPPAAAPAPTPAPAPRAESTSPGVPQQARPPAAAQPTTPAPAASAQRTPPARSEATAPPAAPQAPTARTQAAPAAAPPAPGAGYNIAPQAGTEEEIDSTPEPSAAQASPAIPAGRVMLRARQDAWVQIQASNGTTVFARTMRAGESYTLPEQSGLRLTTGNAGALDIVVDGQTTPALGQIGAVRRNVSLDPNRLKAGTALE
ncbi:MAG: RodZ domain-containing protein [Gemmatimonas sp.]